MKSSKLYLPGLLKHVLRSISGYKSHNEHEIDLTMLLAVLQLLSLKARLETFVQIFLESYTATKLQVIFFCIDLEKKREKKIINVGVNICLKVAI